MKSFRTLLLALLIGSVAGCPRGSSGERPNPLAKAGMVSSATTEAGYADFGQASWSVLRGTADFGATFKTQAGMPEIANAATVSLIRADDGQTVSSAVTGTGGKFELTFPPSFKPDPTKTYILEAVKGLSGGEKPNRVGADAARIRTFIRFTGTDWLALTADGFTIDRTTTALAAIIGLRSIAADGYVGSLVTSPKSPVGADKFTPPSGSPVTQAEVDAVYKLVDEAIRSDRDPIFTIVYNTTAGTYALAAPSAILLSVTPAAGRVGETVSIKGANFSPDPEFDVVRFNGVEATSRGVNQTGTELQVVVPVGALGGPLTVQIGSLVFGGLNFHVRSWDGHNVFDAQDNLYVAGYGNKTLWKVDPSGKPTRIVQDNLLDGPAGVVLDSAGNIFVSSWNRNAIVKVATGSSWVVSDFVTGNGMDRPWYLAIDPADNLFVSSYGNDRVFKITPGKTISDYGTGALSPSGLAFGPDGSLYVSGYGQNKVYKVPPGGGAATTFYNNAAVLQNPVGLAFDPLGKLYVADRPSSTVFSITPAGRAEPITGLSSRQIGASSLAFRNDGVLHIGSWEDHSLWRVTASGSVLPLRTAPRGVWAITKDADGNIYLGTTFTPKNWQTRFHANLLLDYNLYKVPYLGSGKYGPFEVLATGFNSITGLAINPVDNQIYVGEYSGRIYKVDRTTGRYLPWANSGVSPISQMAFDKDGNLWIGYWRNNWYTYRITPSGSRDTLWAGRRITGCAVGGGKYWWAMNADGMIVSSNGLSPDATNKLEVNGGISSPQALAFDTTGNVLYIASGDNWIRKYDPGTGAVSNFTSNGISSPWGILVSGNKVYVANNGNGTVTRYARGGDGTVEKTVTIGGNPNGLAIGANGKLYVGNHNGEIFTVSDPAGTMTKDGSRHAYLNIWRPSSGRTDVLALWGLAFDSAGTTLYASIGAPGRYRVSGLYKVTPGVAPFSGDTLTNVRAWDQAWIGSCCNKGSRQITLDPASGHIIMGAGSFLGSGRDMSSGALGLAYRLASRDRIWIGVGLYRSFGVQPGPLVGGVQSMYVSPGRHRRSFPGIVQVLSASPLTWRRVYSTSGAAIITDQAAMQFTYDPNFPAGEGSYVVGQIAGRRSYPGVGFYNAKTGAFRSLSSNAGWCQTGVWSPAGDLILGCGWAGVENAPLQLFAGGNGSAQIMDNWFYRPAF